MQFAMAVYTREFAQAQFRRLASAVPNLIAIGSTVVRQKKGCDSDFVLESCQIQDLLKSRNN